MKVFEPNGIQGRKESFNDCTFFQPPQPCRCGSRGSAWPGALPQSGRWLHVLRSCAILSYGNYACETPQGGKNRPGHCARGERRGSAESLDSSCSPQGPLESYPAQLALVRARAGASIMLAGHKEVTVGSIQIAREALGT